jgi:3-oxoacyl-[acyl-carrier protein] reductase
MAVLHQQSNEQTPKLMMRVGRAEKTAQTINSDGGAAIVVAGDITCNEDISILVQKAVEFGGGKLHIIVNNAGYAWDDPIEKIQDKQWGES